MNLPAADALRQRIAEYRHLRSVTRDKQALEVIDGIIAEAEEQLRQLEGPTPEVVG